MIDVSQYNFDYECLTDESRSLDIEKLVTDVLDDLGCYVVGFMVDADEVDWTGYDDINPEDVHICGLDYFRTGDLTSSDISAAISAVLRERGCELIGEDFESAEYDDRIIDDVARWYKVPKAKVLDDLYEAGYNVPY